jgi:hypothetical protein
MVGCLNDGRIEFVFKRIGHYWKQRLGGSRIGVELRVKEVVVITKRVLGNSSNNNNSRIVFAWLRRSGEDEMDRISMRISNR